MTSPHAKIHSLTEVKTWRKQRVLVRVDFNVPVKNGRVVDDFKIKKSLPTLQYLMGKGAKVVIISHLGRPHGVEPALSLRPVKNHLAKLLKHKIKFIKEIGTPQVLLALRRGLKRLAPGGLIMLENIRFLAEERDKDEQFAKDLATVADIFVSECFAVSHHPAPSISSVPKYLPSYAGLLLAEEIIGLSKVMTKPDRPLVIILGGSKAETKIPVLKNLLPQASAVLVSGGIVNTYLAARGFKVGASSVDKAQYREALAVGRKRKVILPVDFVVGRFDGRDAQVVKFDKKFAIRDKRYAIYDVGPATVRLFAKHIKTARTLIFNGALGMFEAHPYEYATRAVTELFAARSKGRAFGVCGGGETVQVVRQLGLQDQIDLMSTGGGAMLEFLSGKKLPGIATLWRK